MNHQSGNDSEKKIAVYYDGRCPMCTSIINMIDDSSKAAKFSIRDIRKESLPQAFTKQDVEKEIHVVADGKIYKNAEAILKILEEYPAWKFFVWIGRLPLIKEILRIGYKFVCANRHFLFGPATRIYWLKVVISFGFIFGLLLSVKLWLSSRFYPLTPILNIFPSIPYPIEWIIPLVLICLLAATILSSEPKPLIWSSVAVVSLLAFLDQQRLQPWVYQYAFMLGTLGLFSWKWDDSEGKNATLNACRFIVASIYFWSGLQKVNLEFMRSVFPWMVAPIAQLFPASMQPAFYILGLLVPFIEIAIGVGLLTRKFRNAAIWLALGMCVFVLWAIGPFGHDRNRVVWPWNITMAILVVILFAKTKNVPLSRILWVRHCAFHKVILVVFGLMPLFYFFNVWDSYLSWALYSGTTNKSAIYVSDRVKKRLPNYIQQFVQIDGGGRNFISISRWAFTELHVPPYPESRIFKSVAKNICRAASDPHEVVLVMRGRLSWFYPDGQQVLNCAQLN